MNAMAVAAGEFWRRLYVGALGNAIVVLDIAWTHTKIPQCFFLLFV
jgi:hypothetical protein